MTESVWRPILKNPLLKLLPSPALPTSSSGATGVSIDGVWLTWATVTDAYPDPVQIQVDTEAAPLAGTPSMLCQVMIGDRVLVAISNRQVTVLGVGQPDQSPSQITPSAQVFQNAAQSFTANVRTAVSWDTLNYDAAGNMWSSSATDRLTIPFDGLYTVSYVVVFPNVTAVVNAYLMKNGGYVQGGSDVRVGTSSSFSQPRATLDKHLTAGDYLQVHVNPSVAITSEGTSLSNGTMLQARLVSQ